MTEPNFFSEHSPYLDHPLLTDGRTAQEAAFLVSQCELRSGSRVLDVGCGFGRHSVALAERGCAVVGIDPSPAMLQAAREQAAQRSVNPQFFQASGQDYVSKTPFDAAICLFTTLGQITGSRDNGEMLANIAGLLLPGGYLAVETPQRAAAIRLLRESDRFGTDTNYTRVTRRYNGETQVVTEFFTVVGPQSTRNFALCYRLYSRQELEMMLAQAGLHICARFSDYQGALLEQDSPYMLVIARR